MPLYHNDTARRHAWANDGHDEDAAAANDDSGNDDEASNDTVSNGADDAANDDAEASDDAVTTGGSPITSTPPSTAATCGATAEGAGVWPRFWWARRTTGRTGMMIVCKGVRAAPKMWDRRRLAVRASWGAGTAWQVSRRC